MNTLTCCGLALVAFSQGVVAQPIENRVSTAKGSVAFEFNARHNVCGNGSSIYISNDTSPGWTRRSRRSGITMGNGGRGDRSVCTEGPVRVVLTHSGSKIGELRASVGGREERADVELGEVTPADASHYLLSIAPALSGRPADNAIMGAAIADIAIDWRRMLEIARNNDATETARKSALFWVSNEAGSVATAGLSDVAMDDDAETSVRSDALFFLSQRKNGEDVPALIRVVRESKSIKLRKDAIWFLSQSRDPRALDLFEKLLAGR